MLNISFSTGSDETKFRIVSHILFATKYCFADARSIVFFRSTCVTLERGDDGARFSEWALVNKVDMVYFSPERFGV